MQDLVESASIKVDYKDYQIVPDDILNIKVYSQSPELNEIFNNSLSKDLVLTWKPFKLMDIK